VQRPLNFPEWVYGLDRDMPDLMVKVTTRLSETLGAHAGDHDMETTSKSISPHPSR
jgi:hypothetical protein